MRPARACVVRVFCVPMVVSYPSVLTSSSHGVRPSHSRVASPTGAAPTASKLVGGVGDAFSCDDRPRPTDRTRPTTRRGVWTPDRWGSGREGIPPRRTSMHGRTRSHTTRTARCDAMRCDAMRCAISRARARWSIDGDHRCRSIIDVDRSIIVIDDDDRYGTGRPRGCDRLHVCWGVATPSPVIDWCGVARALMWCAISGTTPTNAVVTPGGVVYDKALIVKAIEVGVCGAMGVRGATSRAWISWMDCACDGECVCVRSLARVLCVCAWV